MNKKAFSLVEILVGTAVTSIVMGGLITGWMLWEKRSKSDRYRSQIEIDAAQLASLISHYGKLAKNCDKVVGGGPTVSLVCDWQNAGGASRKTRFAAFGGAYASCTEACSVNLEEDVSGVWQTRQTFSAVSFDVCDSAEIAAATCTGWTPAYALSAAGDRFFRYRVSTFLEGSGKYVIQSAFTQRNVSGTMGYLWDPFGGKQQ